MDRSGRAKASIFRTPSGASELCGEHYQGGWMLGCRHGELVLKAILPARVLATHGEISGKAKARECQPHHGFRKLN